MGFENGNAGRWRCHLLVHAIRGVRYARSDSEKKNTKSTRLTFPPPLPSSAALQVIREPTRQRRRRALRVLVRFIGAFLAGFEGREGRGDAVVGAVGWDVVRVEGTFAAGGGGLDFEAVCVCVCVREQGAGRGGGERGGGEEEEEERNEWRERERGGEEMGGVRTVRRRF